MFIWVHIYIFLPKLLRWNFFQILQVYLYEVVRPNFSADFGTFRNFWPQFRENCGAIYRRIWELCSASEIALTCEKRLKTASKSGNKGQRNACSNYAPLECTVLRIRSVTNKKTNKPKNKHHIFAPTIFPAPAIFPKLCMVIELVEPIIKVTIHFLIQRTVFPTGCFEKFGVIYRRAVSQQ